MVGLSDVKKVTDEILAAAKMQKMRKQMGLPGVQSSMHMLFSGNPGTAKTTVARLLSQVLKEEEVLKYGHIVECGWSENMSAGRHRLLRVNFRRRVAAFCLSMRRILL